MEEAMADRRGVTIAATNIISPLGMTSAATYQAVRAGRSSVKRYDRPWHLPHPVMASLMDRQQTDAAFGAGAERYTRFERMAIVSIREALSHCDIDVQSARTLFVLSTTKGNVDLLRENPEGLPAERLLPGEAATVIARHFGNDHEPLVVSNACISGACALAEAARLIRLGRYDQAVVCGADVLSPFIVSGFHSLMAIADAPCRPFDEDRMGINLGEAAATIILKGENHSTAGAWTLRAEAVRNDAYHISSPSRNGEGCYRALRGVLSFVPIDELAFVNVHGTATMFNDEMEAQALWRAGLSAVPVNSLKGYFGHTMGAAGVLESIISMLAADDGVVLGTKGFATLGVSKPVNIAADCRPTDKRMFIKTLSGFGGCNAALLFSKQ